MQSPVPDALSKVQSTPTKEKSSEKNKGSPLVAELEICLTPKSKLKEVLERSAEKFKDKSVKEKDGNKTEASRILFSVEQKSIEVTDKVNKLLCEKLSLFILDSCNPSCCFGSMETQPKM